MKIYDTQWNVIENPDLEKGYLEEIQRLITHRYIISQKEIGHFEVVKEYPNGGKDVAWVIDTPEEGKWVTYDENNNEIECNNIIPDDAPHEQDINDYEIVYSYILYTEEELAQIAEEEARALEPTVEDMLNVLIGLEV